MKTSISNPRQMGAIPLDEGVQFRVWAPNASSVSVVGEFNGWNAEANPLRREEAGNWRGVVPEAKVGHQYQFALTNGELRLQKNDPYARQIHGQKATSVVYADTYRWQSKPLVLPNWNELVIYELHVGTFEAGPKDGIGRFDQIIRRLPYLKNLGINALELMPPMAFPSKTSWGYSLTNPFAVEPSYGGPEGLKRLVDAAHQEGIGIIMDVVINHFGPDDLDLWQFDGWQENNKGGIYFYNDHRAWTPWGENRPDYGRGEVRQYLRDSCLLWLDEFHCDGLRVDATLFIRNARGENNNPAADLPDGWTLMQWINDEVNRLFPGRIKIAEDLMQSNWVCKPTREGGLGYDTQWDSAFVHPIRNSVVSIDDADRSMSDVAKAIKFRYNDDFVQRIIYSESHDQVANGQARVPQEIDPSDPGGYFARKRSTLAAGLVFTTPGIPMLFEGQEFLEDRWFRENVPVDWHKLETFKGINRLYHDLIHLRRNLYGNTKGLTGPYVTVHHYNDNDKVIGMHRWASGGPKDDVIVIASFTNRVLNDYRVGFPRGGTWTIRFNSDSKGYSEDFSDVSSPDGHVTVEKEDRDGCAFTGVVSLPAYGILIFSQEEGEGEEPPPDAGGSPS